MTDDFTLELRAVVKAHLQSGAGPHHMRVGEQVAIGGEEEPRAVTAPMLERHHAGSGALDQRLQLVTEELERAHAQRPPSVTCEIETWPLRKYFTGTC